MGILWTRREEVAAAWLRRRGRLARRNRTEHALQQPRGTSTASCASHVRAASRPCTDLRAALRKALRGTLRLSTCKKKKRLSRRNFVVRRIFGNVFCGLSFNISEMVSYSLANANLDLQLFCGQPAAFRRTRALVPASRSRRGPPLFSLNFFTNMINRHKLSKSVDDVSLIFCLGTMRKFVKLALVDVLENVEERILT